MKKFLMLLSILSFLLVIAQGAWAVPTVPKTGTWTSSDDFNKGRWIEYFVGGGPGQVGNVLKANAYSSPFSMSWYMDNYDFTILSAPPVGVSTPEGWMQYTTSYTGGKIHLKYNDTSLTGDPWANDAGSGEYVFSITELLVVAYIDPATGRYAFSNKVQVPGEITLTGIYTKDPLYTLSITGLLSEGGSANSYFTLSGTEYLGHWGDIKDMTLTIASTSVSEPATMLLLGFGLMGLAGFGRKKLFNK